MSAETLDTFLSSAKSADESSADVAALVLDIATACRAIGERLPDDVLRAGGDHAIAVRAPSQELPKAFVLLDDHCAPGASGKREWTARLMSTLRESRESTSCGLHRGRHLALLVPIDNPANIDVNAAVGTIFSIWRMRASPSSGDASAVVETQSAPLCTGYAIHGPSLVLVVALAAGVHAFAYDRQRDEFVRVRADMRIPAKTHRIAVDAADMRSSDPALRRYLDECLAGEAGPRGRDFRFSWCGSLVTEIHRILMFGGIFVCPGSRAMAIHKPPLRLLEEVGPLCHVIERAGGRASTGTTRLLAAAFSGARLHEPLVVGAVEEVQRFESYRRDPDALPYDAPLFGSRGLFRPAV